MRARQPRYDGSMGVPHSASSLAADLGRLGVAHGDAVMVHASLRAIGPMEDGAATLIEALDRAVGATGAVLMVLGADNDWAWVNQHDESERAAHLAEAVPFDALVTPAESEVGVLAEVLRVHPGTLVSDHPEGRFAARGHQAAALLADPPWHDYFGPGSPLERLVDRGGKIARLGADPDTTTMLHYAEYLAHLPDKRRVRRHRRVCSPDGPVIRCVESLDDEHGIVDYPGDGDYFAAILTAYLATARARTGTVGGAASQLIAAGDLVSFAVAWMNRHLAPPPTS